MKKLIIGAFAAALLSACAGGVTVSGMNMPAGMKAHQEGSTKNQDSRFHNAIMVDDINALADRSGVASQLSQDDPYSHSSLFTDEDHIRDRILMALTRNGLKQQGLTWNAENLLSITVLEWFDESRVIRKSAKNMVGVLLGFSPTEDDWSEKQIQRGYYFQRFNIRYKLVSNKGVTLINKEYSRENKVKLVWKSDSYKSVGEIGHDEFLDRSFNQFLEDLHKLEAGS